MSTKDALQILDDQKPTLEALVKLNAEVGVDVSAVVLQELEYLKMATLQKPDILKCIPESVVSAIKGILKKNLTLDPSAGLVYIKTRNVKVKNASGVDVDAKILELQESANGIISVARQCGRILDMKNPKVTKDADGKVIEVEIEILLPSVPNPRWEVRAFDESDILRWRTASHKENSKWKNDANAVTLNYANPNYTSWKGGIDPEFARAKAVRHGLKKLGVNQNETRVKRIVASPINVVIDTDRDMESAYEITGEGLPSADDL